MSEPISTNAAGRLGRRDLLKVGGLTVSLTAIAAACGVKSTGGTDPGRIGVAPPITAPPEYPVDDAVRLRTASSFEQSTVMVYEAILGLDVLDADATALFEKLVANHQAIAKTMDGLTVDAGGQVWPCTNPWLDDRLLSPVVDAIKDSDNQLRDIYNVAVSFENLGAATYQQFAVDFTDVDQRSAAIGAAAQTSRQSAVLAITAGGADRYFSPVIDGGEVELDADAVAVQYALPFRFGSVAQFELLAGKLDDEGKRTDFLLQTPAENSYVYAELEPSC
jgi:hypothetical protein